MVISELRKELKRAQKLHGDLDVGVIHRLGKYHDAKEAIETGGNAIDTDTTVCFDDYDDPTTIIIW